MAEIPFNTIPAGWKVPGVYGEILPGQNSNAAMVVPPKILLVGQKLTAGSATAEVIRRVYSADEVGALCGRGSMLHQMAKKSFANAPYVPTYLLPLADAAGTKATRTITITGTATQAGALFAYVGDTLYQVNVAIGATGAQIATALAAAITNDVDRYTDAAAATTVVTLTARHAGVDAGVVPATYNRFSTQVLPTGLTVAVSALAAGTVNPSLANGIAAMADEWFPTIVAPYTDSTNLDLLKAEMVDRWGALRSIEGNAFTYQLDTVTNELTFATSRNDYALSPIDCNDRQTPPFATICCDAALDAAEPDPAKPRHTLICAGTLAKGRAGRRTAAERNNLINGGISTSVVNDDGSVAIEYLTTSYRTNTYGAPDSNYFDIENLRTVASIRYSARTRWKAKYRRAKLGPDGSTGDNVVTPSVVKGEFSAMYDDWMAAGWVKGGAAKTRFLAAMLAQINSVDPNRMDALITPELMNQQRILAISIQFKR